MLLPGSRSLTALALSAALAAAAAAVLVARQVPNRPAQPLAVVSPEGRRALPAWQVGDQLMVALDDLATLFGLTVREDAVGGGLSVTTRAGKRVLLTPGQPLASADGRLVSLPAAPVRDGQRWLVPLEFVARALSPVLQARVEVRRNSRLVLVGDVRVPRVDVREQEVGGAVRLTLSVAPRAGHQVVREGNRLLLQFDATALDASLPAVPPGPLLQGIRLGDPATTIVLDLGPRFGSYRASATTRDANSELVVELVPAFVEQAIPVPPKPGQPVPPSEPLPQVAPAPPTVRTVVLDPGHGGQENGASATGGSAEKDIALAVARRVKAVLEARLGLRVLMTRDGDQPVSLDDRAALANTNKADLFISLHVNASFRPATRGAQVFYLAPDEKGEDARRASLAGQALPTLGGGARDVELILWELAQVPHIGESAAFAGILEEELRARVPVNERAVLRAPFRVLAAANMPAVVLELGYLSNPEEASALKSPARQDLLTQALLQAIVRFRSVREQGIPAAAAPTAPAAPPRGPDRSRFLP